MRTGRSSTTTALPRPNPRTACRTGGTRRRPGSPGSTEARPMAEGRLAGRVALVTGAGQGIGRGIALAMAAEGAAIAVVDLDGRNADRTAREVRDRGRPALAVRCDVRVRAEVQAAVAATAEEFGGLDILV